MTIYTAMPMELVLDGIQNEPGPFVEVTVQGVMMQLIPIAPGMGKIVRLLSAPLNCYLSTEYAPGQTVCYYPTPELRQGQELPDFGM
ncbi:YlzJ-like family protein [Cohnella cholangitidis]|uniref:YlzJ-like protein n=1 Tax=Cohnella cholangitidis TaxID=2598458 RepID=A0A7G5BT24_9BACL|nr:YlzJ-like family protein [Cohnella cholangitidis]QMV40108.1 hypothetical protein FPL14_02010 [Cohnella cholangitidis]